MQHPLELQEYLARGYREKYGMLWAPNPDGTPLTDIQVEFAAFSANLPSKAEHFWRIVGFLWNRPESIKRFERTPWADKMVEHLCKHRYLAIAGCGSSGKSECGAVWGLVSFFASPTNTKVLLTSTTLKDSRNRIWGVVEDYWQAAAQFLGEENMPGELVRASGTIRFRQGERRLDRYGLTLIAGDKSKAKESIGKLIGFKAVNMILIADELPELSDVLVKAAKANLSLNQNFQMVGIGNPNSRFDPFGVFCEPAAGWESINQHSEEWQAKSAYVIRFDGEKSPNILAGRTIYEWMMTEEKLEEKRKELGSNTLLYWRMVRGFFCPTGSSESIFNEVDILAYEGEKKAIWREPPKLVAGIDPAYTQGGDRCVMVVSKYGTTTAGIKTLDFEEVIEIQEDADRKDESRSEQLIRQIMALCEERGIAPENVAVDETGGQAFSDWLGTMWSNKFMRVNFAGAPSELAVSPTNPKPASEVYANKVSEIWFSGSQHLRSNQIRGLTKEMAEELTARLYETKNRGRIQVESKKDMKKRFGKSPDIGDAAMLCLHLCRHRLGMVSLARPAESKNRRLDFGPKPFKMLARRLLKLRKY